MKIRAWFLGTGKVGSPKAGMYKVNGLDLSRKLIYLNKNNHIPYRTRTNRCKLMLYSRVKDKNGVDIYDGDIVLSKPLVECGGIKDDSLRVKCEVKFGISFYLDGPVWGLLDGEHEVIGNIYENAYTERRFEMANDIDMWNDIEDANYSEEADDLLDCYAAKFIGNCDCPEELKDKFIEKYGYWGNYY